MRTECAADAHAREQYCPRFPCLGFQITPQVPHVASVGVGRAAFRHSSEQYLRPLNTGSPHGQNRVRRDSLRSVFAHF